MSEEKSKFVRVKELAALLECSDAHAYKLIREMNNELHNMGKITVAGRVSRKYLEERLFL